MDGTASALAPASKVSATTGRVVGMAVQSFPASQPVTGAAPADAGLVPDGRAEDVPGGLVADGALVGGLVAGRREGVIVAGAVASDVGRAPGCVPGDGAPPPQAATPASTAPAAASRIISNGLIP